MASGSDSALGPFSPHDPPPLCFTAGREKRSIVLSLPELLAYTTYSLPSHTKGTAACPQRWRLPVYHMTSDVTCKASIEMMPLSLRKKNCWRARAALASL